MSTLGTANLSPDEVTDVFAYVQECIDAGVEATAMSWRRRWKRRTGMRSDITSEQFAVAQQAVAKVNKGKARG